MNGLELRAALCKTAKPIAPIILLMIMSAACTPRSGLEISNFPEQYFPEQSLMQLERGKPMRQARTFSTHSHSTSQSTYSSSHSSSHSGQSSSQHHSALNVRSRELGQPHILAIATSGTAMTGQITLNGKIIQPIQETRTEINLSPYLSIGQHILEISVSYTPPSASMSVGFTAPGTQVMNQTSGNGRISHIFNIRVDE